MWLSMAAENSTFEEFVKDKNNFSREIGRMLDTLIAQKTKKLNIKEDRN